MRGATRHFGIKIWEAEDFYSHAPCGARLALWVVQQQSASYFYSHAPCGARPFLTPVIFKLGIYFYSHAPCGARLIQADFSTYSSYFYSHAPCGARLETLFSNRLDFTFLLTRPMRGATILSNCGVGILTISTHTPHAGRDPCPGIACTVSTYFYSHAPCGARHKSNNLRMIL